MSTELKQRAFEITTEAHNLKAQIGDLHAIKTTLVRALDEIQNANARGVNNGVNTEMQLRVAYLAMDALTREMESRIKSLDINSELVRMLVDNPLINEFFAYKERTPQKEQAEAPKEEK